LFKYYELSGGIVNGDCIHHGEDEEEIIKPHAIWGSKSPDYKVALGEQPGVFVFFLHLTPGHNR